MSEKVMVVCVDIFTDHTPESVIVKCSECGKKLWCSPWNVDKTPICAYCATKKQNVKSCISLRDLFRAKEFFKRRT